MCFGLSNAPSAFQALTNQVLRPFLRRFLLVFFDDILIYNPNIITHLTHLGVVLNLLRDNKLYANYKKCQFFKERVQYLGLGALDYRWKSWGRRGENQGDGAVANSLKCQGVKWVPWPQGVLQTVCTELWDHSGSITCLDQEGCFRLEWHGWRSFWKTKESNGNITSFSLTEFCYPIHIGD